MGGHKGWAQPSGFSPNGLLHNEAASVTRVLDPERWLQVEARTAGLLACIQPSQPSEERRNAVASYVKHLIMKCFSCQVFTFGSVPLKTYLPDGDIDLTAFSKNQKLKDTWANEVRDMLESEEKSEDAEFRVKEVQYIQAEVKIIKCLVENIVVDISFNQLGGLCTLCFLEQVDQLINQNHLFKRSIILIKAWCYYESRILGAHHGLISTYALETLVLYIFHVFNCSFAGPLEVLYRFLEFFSKFDWDNFCVSLWGPVPINSLPNMTVEPPRKDDGELLLGKLFLDVCSSAYAVLPGSQENQEQPFVSKHFNIVDPLRTNNNLGRSVSKGNFFRIRSAFAFGAQRLARLLDCPQENLIDEVNQFFMNTWDRHGKGHRLDAPSPDLYGLRSVYLNQIDGSDSLRNYSSSNNAKEDSVGHESEVDVTSVSHASHDVSSQHGNQSLRQMSRTGNISAVSLTQVQNIYANLTNSMASDQNPEILQNINFNENTYTDKSRSTRSDYMTNEVHARYQFARTHSSPELTGTSSEVLSRGRRNRALETRNGHTAPARSDNSRRNLGPKVLDNNSARFSTGDSPSLRQSSSDRSIDAAVDSNNASNSYYGDSGVGAMGENRQFVDEAMQMNQEEQDFVNMMASRGYNFNGQVHMPFNLSSAYPPFPIPPASLGYAQKNLAGMVPTNVPSFESSWGSNMRNVQDLVPLPVSQYFPTVGMASYREELTDLVDSNLVSMELKQAVGDHGFWPERDADPVRSYDRSNRSLQARPLEDRQQFTSVGSNSVHSSRVSSSDSSSLKDNGLSMDNKRLNGENYSDNFQYQRIGDSDSYSTYSSRSVPASQTTSSRTKLSSENFWDGSSLKNSKSTRDKQGRKSAPPTDPSAVYGLGENGWQHEGESVDHVSSPADDDIREWIPLSTVGTDAAESTVSGSVTSSRVQTHQRPGYEPALVSGPNSVLPVAPVLVDPESQQRANDNHGVLPFTFYPTGPPIPFFAMIPVYNLPTETGISSVSRNHFDRDEEFNKSKKSQLDHSLDSTENLGHSDIFSTSDSLKDAASVEPSEQHKSDILNGDFSSNWQNLQYGRFCQNARQHGPLHYPPSVVVPPMNLQGHFPWDGPGRPPTANMNNLTQFMGYNPRLIPVSPMQPGSSRLSGEIPRYRGGTGTYLPNPKMSFRDRQSSNTRSHRGNYSYDRKDHHGDREGNWNINSKSRFVGRGQGRNQYEKPSMRANRGTASNSRSDKPWDSFKHDPSYYSHNGSYSFSNSMNRGSNNLAYGMYPMPVENPSGVSPSVVMLYPYDQNMGYGSPAEQLESGSLGPVHFSGIDDASHLIEGSSRAINEQRDFRSHISEGSSRAINEQRDFQGDSGHSSPDQPSSPRLQRGV